MLPIWGQRDRKPEGIVAVGILNVAGMSELDCGQLKTVSIEAGNFGFPILGGAKYGSKVGQGLKIYACRHLREALTT